MSRLNNLDDKLKVINSAPLKDNSKVTKNIMVYNVPTEWINILKENGASFSGYAKMAILEKMKKDGLI